MQDYPLFICHANCARSVLGQYLYSGLTGHPAESAGIEAGSSINSRVKKMLARWRIDASAHRPRKVTRESCEKAAAIFAMGPKYALAVLKDVGVDLAHKTYLFADPFSLPESFSDDAYHVKDPSFSHLHTSDLVKKYSWMRERVLQIRLALLKDGKSMHPASEYMGLLRKL